MFRNLSEVYPEIEFYKLINKLTNEEFDVTMTTLNDMFGEEKVIQMMNNSNPYWLILKGMK